MARRLKCHFATSEARFTKCGIETGADRNVVHHIANIHSYMNRLVYVCVCCC